MLTVLLPIALAWLMFCVGLKTELAAFKNLGQEKVKIILGVGLQVLAMPLLVWLFLQVFYLDNVVALGLVLVALSPGGASSNSITYLSRGNVPLSIMMTTISSLLVPLTLPFFLSYFTHFEIAIPIEKTVLQLFVVTVLPLGLGLLLGHYWGRNSRWVNRFDKSAIWVFIFMVGLVVGMNEHFWEHIFTWNSILILSFCVLACGLGWLSALLFNFTSRDQVTMSIEVGIQNAGTAIFVAMSLLEMPESAIIPLQYGVLMNIPALCFIFLGRKREQWVFSR
ncbi:bile acid:sodium symporter family protein [Persicobacter sp. CCB-QB2]|uniref:bile acid:sodium symporter family protein n=1 Tax=Persicobacter sp. CCB-QB2 TaxID=1561025 RepID=UPI00092E94E6|nr:bile acid:sodium symporter family protein [Persicobacter sp. CCB-QB2]